MNPVAENNGHTRSLNELRAFGQIAARLLQRPARHILHEQDGDVVQHEGGDDLAHAPAHLQQAGDHGPQDAADHAADQHRRDEQRLRPARKGQRNRSADQRADVVLPLAADVPDAGTECRRQTQPHQEQGRRLEQRLFDLALAAERALEHDGVGLNRVGPGDQDQQRPDGQPGSDSCQRRSEGDHPFRHVPGVRKRLRFRRCGRHAPSWPMTG